MPLVLDAWLQIQTHCIWDYKHKKLNYNLFIRISCIIHAHSSKDQTSFKTGSRISCYFIDSDTNGPECQMSFSQTEPVWMPLILCMDTEALCSFSMSQRKWPNAELGLLWPHLTCFGGKQVWLVHAAKAGRQMAKQHVSTKLGGTRSTQLWPFWDYQCWVGAAQRRLQYNAKLKSDIAWKIQFGYSAWKMFMCLSCISQMALFLTSYIFKMPPDPQQSLFLVPIWENPHLHIHRKTN